MVEPNNTRPNGENEEEFFSLRDELQLLSNKSGKKKGKVKDEKPLTDDELKKAQQRDKWDSL